MTSIAAPSTMRRDILSAYALTGGRVLSWVVVSAVVYRILGHDAFAVVALIRGTIGILAYSSIGLAPALVRKLAESATGSVATDAAQDRPDQRVLDTYVSGELLAILLGVLGLALTGVYGLNLDRIHKLPALIAHRDAVELAVLFGIGMVVRLISEARGGLLQIRGKIALDNLLLAGAEICWAALVCGFLIGGRGLSSVGLAFMLTNFGLLFARSTVARALVRQLAGRGDPRLAIMAALLSYGAMVMLAQSADFLYAPMDYILINRLLDPAVVADYAPAVQIDAGLLLLVTGVAAVLLPKTAIAHTSGDLRRVRRYYLAGTLFTTATLGASALGVWAVSRWIFQLWLGEPMTATRAILPLVLVHTVVGGSSAVGRSVLLGMGKVKPFTAAVLIAGITNVACSVLFAWYLGWGLNGIVLGTIVAVVGRCAIWMPWYILRTLRSGAGTQTGPAILPETTLG